MSIEQLRDHYQRQGYCVHPHRLPLPLLEAANKAIDQWIDEYPLQEKHAVFEIHPQYQSHEEELFRSAEGIYGFLESEALDERSQLRVKKRDAFNKIGHALHDLIPEVGALAEHEVIRQCVGVTGIEVAHLIQSMVIFKSARFGAAVPWHQDATYLISTPQSVFGLWIALEDATVNNGCLWVAPGHHLSPLRELYKVDWASRSGLKHPLHDQPWPMESEAIPLEVKAGSVVIFHDHMPHKSEMNISEKSRRALTFHCHDSSAAWSAENWLHRRRLSPHLISAMAEL